MSAAVRVVGGAPSLHGRAWITPGEVPRPYTEAFHGWRQRWKRKSPISRQAPGEDWRGYLVIAPSRSRAPTYRRSVSSSLWPTSVSSARCRTSAPRGDLGHDRKYDARRRPESSLDGCARKAEWRRILSLLTCLGVTAVVSAGAQSLTTGAVVGTVGDSMGIGLDDALLTLTEVETGLHAHRDEFEERSVSFCPLIQPGEYSPSRVEHLGYRPTMVRGVLIRPGVTTEVVVALNPAAPPISRVDTVRLGRGVTEGVWRVVPGEHRAWTPRCHRRRVRHCASLVVRYTRPRNARSPERT